MDGPTQETSVLALYGALDRLASSGVIPTDELAFWVPHYATGLEPGWFQDFAGSVGIELSDPFDDIDKALAELRDLGAVTRGSDEDERSMTHRFHALAVISQLLPDDYGPGAERAPLMQEALQHIVEFHPLGARTVDDTAAARLHELTHETAALHNADGASTFGEIVQSAVSNDFITSFMLNHQNVMCDGKIVPQTDIHGDVVDAALLETKFCSDDLDFKGLVNTLLNPGKWDECFAGFWCEMTPLDGIAGPISAGDLRRYDEVVGSCGNPDSWRIKTCLEFMKLKTDGPNLVTIQYRLCEQGQPTPPLVTVDAGFLQVERKNDGQVCVTTQKVVAFDGIPSLGIALFACVTGWSHGAVDIAYSCGGKKTPDAPVDSGSFKSEAPPNQVLENPDTKSESSEDDGFDKIADDALGYCEEWVTDCLAQWKTTASHLSSGTYSGEKMSSDVLSYMTRMARDWSRVASLGVRTMAASASVPTSVTPASRRIQSNVTQQPAKSNGARAPAPAPAPAETAITKPPKPKHGSEGKGKGKGKGSSKETNK